MQAVGVCKGQPCLLVSRFLYRHAHSTKLRTSLLYRTASTGIRLDKLKLQLPHGLLQVSSALEEDTQECDAGTKVVKVKFVLQRRCEFGQQFGVIGDEELLGAWAPEAAIPMQWSEGHIWTVELDLSVGTCAEFKVILMAEQKLLEWQPGPNHKLELSGDTSSLVVFVAWSDEEDNIKIDAQVDVETNEFLRTQDVETNEFLRTQDGVETASSVGDIEFETIDVTEEQMIEEKSTNSGMIEATAKDFIDEWQTEAKGIATGDEEAIDARASLNSEVESAEVKSPFAIPESWYSEEEEYEEKSGVSSSHDPTESSPGLSSSHDSTESSPVSPEDITKGQTVSSATSDDDTEDKNGEKRMLLDRPDEVISEGKASSMILTTEFEPITRDQKDVEPRVLDVLVEVTSPGNVETLLTDAELNDINEESREKHIVQNGPVEVIAETSSETVISTTISNNQDHSDKEVMVDDELPVAIAEVPEIELASMTTDSLEDVETKPSVTAKEKRWGHKGWSKLWGAFVHGRMPQ